MPVPILSIALSAKSSVEPISACVNPTSTSIAEPFGGASDAPLPKVRVVPLTEYAAFS